MSFRLEAAELLHLRMPLRAPFETSFGVERDRECVLIRLEADGLTGWGECVAGGWPGYSYETAGTAWHILSEYFLPAVLGGRFEGPDDLGGHLKPFRGHPMARAGLELALWDLGGKANGRSLKQMLGGERPSVPVGVSIGIQADVEALLDVVGGFIERGYRRIKLKIKPGRDQDEVSAVRAAYPNLDLQVDANSAYTLEDTGVFESMDGLGLLLIEQPLAEDDLVDHSRLQARLRTPICLDESITSARHAAQALDLGSCRVINIKPGRVGGLLEAIGIHDVARERSVPVWCGGMLETGIGRAANLALASLPGFTLPGDISATDRYYVEDVTAETFVLNPDSTINVPGGPGLGVTVLQDAVEGFTLRRERRSQISS